MPLVKKDWGEMERKERKVLPDGSYDFEVANAELSTAASGNEMITLRLTVFDGNGGKVSVFDRLVFTDKAGWKIAQFVKAIGSPELVGGELGVTDCMGAAGQSYLKVEESDQWGTRNVVAGYDEPVGTKPIAAAKPVKPPVKAPVPTGDDIPF